MGFPCLCYCVLLPEPLFLLFQMLDHLRYVTSLFFFHLRIGVMISSDSVESLPLTSSTNTTVDDCLIMPHDHQSISAIKSRLQPVKLANLLRAPENGTHNNSNVVFVCTCAVCLGQLNERHEVRELGNCCHLFHRECIDKWVDLGNITCPLCRSPLLPKINININIGCPQVQGETETETETGTGTIPVPVLI